MNNIEVEALKRDMIQYLGFDKKQAEQIFGLTDKKINAVKNALMKIINNNAKSTKDRNQINILKRRITEIITLGGDAKKKIDELEKLKRNNKTDAELEKSIEKLREKSKNIIEKKKLEKKQIIKGSNIGVPRTPFTIEKDKELFVKVDPKRRPKILFISDVKGWAWWIKSHYIKDNIGDEFDIDITYVIGDGSTHHTKINRNIYDLYFSYGFSYIDFLYQVPKKKKVTGVTAHRAKHVIFPKMKLAGHHHANSKMLLKELHDMGFTRAHYVPNGVDEKLFKPINSIKTNGELIVGHVGKECAVKGQREFILPAIKKVGAKSSVNLRNWKDKLPHTEMPQIYNNMDVFIVASTEDGTPNPALEAAACGRPIISNRIGNMPEFIIDGYNGFIVPRKVDAYAEKLRYFQENRDELIRMGENARKTIEEGWTWKIQSENYRMMFRKIFKKKGE